jgi:transposase
MPSFGWGSAVKKTLLYAQAFEAKHYARRKHFLRRRYLAEQQHTPIVYLDETGFAPTTARLWGRAPIGEPVYGRHNAQLRPRTSLIGAYCNRQFLAPMLFEGTCNTALFNDWLEQMLLPDLLVGSMIIMDNATFHKSQRTLDLIAEAGCTLLYLSPYSPDLNPIEKLWANLKRQWRAAAHLSLDELVKQCKYY